MLTPLRQEEWEKITETEIERIERRRRRVAGRKRRWNTKKLYRDLLEIPPGEGRKMKIKSFIERYAIDLSGLSEKLIKKRLRGPINRAVKMGILSSRSVVGNLIIVYRSEIPKEELEERVAFEEEIEELEEM